MITSTSKSKEKVLGANTSGITLPFASIREPGAYVCQWSGHLLRVSEDCIGPERMPRIEAIGQQPLLVTKIDDDPFVPVTRARLQAANHDVAVNF
jgi:hypothetical protein